MVDGRAKAATGKGADEQAGARQWQQQQAVEGSPAPELERYDVRADDAWSTILQWLYWRMGRIEEEVRQERAASGGGGRKSQQ